MPTVGLGYTGATPGADANTYVLFSTTGVAGARVGHPIGTGGVMPQGALPLMDARKFVLNLDHVQAGTVNTYKSQDGGTTWVQISTEAIAAPAASGSTYREFNVEGLKDFKCEWVNGGVGQNPWVVDMSLSCGDRAAP